MSKILIDNDIYLCYDTIRKGGYMVALKWFYVITTIFYCVGVVVNIADNNFDVYQFILLVTLISGWYLIESKTTKKR